MADKVRVWGGMGTKGRPGIQAEIIKMSDKEKKERRLRIVTKDNLERQKQGRKARSVKQYTNEQVLGKFGGIERRRRIGNLQVKAAKLRAKAQGAKDRKTAAQFRQQADSFLKKAAALRGKPKKTATTRPAKKEK